MSPFKYIFIYVCVIWDDIFDLVGTIALVPMMKTEKKNLFCFLLLIFKCLNAVNV